MKVASSVEDEVEDEVDKEVVEAIAVVVPVDPTTPVDVKSPLVEVAGAPLVGAGPLEPMSLVVVAPS